MARKTSIRYLALGDSYTIGESVTEAVRWPVQLTIALRQRGIPIEDPLIIAQTGWTTDELISGIKTAKPKGPFNLVSLLIGVNNQYRGYDIDQYRDEFKLLLEQAIEFAGGNANKVIVLSIPDWSVTPFASDRDTDQISVEVKHFNAVNRQVTQKLKAHYIDITPSSLKAHQDPSLLTTDGLHPSGKMYATWTQLVLPTALKILKG